MSKLILLTVYRNILEKIKDIPKLDYGLCHEIEKMYQNNEIIIFHEVVLVNRDIREQIGCGFVYAWPLDEQGTIERKKYLVNRIQQLTKK